MVKDIMEKALPTETKGVRVLFGEFVNTDYLYSYLGTIIYAESGMQNIFILENKFWGKMLFINNNLQFTTRDEFIYHEALVHIPVQSTPEGSVKKVLICGGGDYGAARELLKYPNIEEVVIVDIDPKIPKLVEEYFPELLPEDPKDPRLKLIIEDAFVMVQRYLEEGKTFDFVIIDSTDPDISDKGVTQELSHALFGVKFHQMLNKLCPQGVIVQQCGTPFTMKNILTETYKTFKQVYPEKEIFCYKANIPSFGSDNAFMLRCSYPNPENPKWKELPNVYYYSHEIHRSAFGLPKFWREALSV
ncbi:spermine synthase [Thermodesulfobacterium sp. TA1]|uniref:spermine/spermidine synthase domain-containing protein n=1 Tax=Thermodesulfobacterium sp. TA1 TaxID=2234087 RepID=UPI0012328DDB|nr:spermine synthase [Thermodesulfobacterium sp. TA1]QER41448.1 spermine synthase [Thermodesulfobacterium sp. TA1]